MRLRMDGSRSSPCTGSTTDCCCRSLLYCVDPSGHLILGPPREGPEIEGFLRTAYQDIPLVVPAIRDFFMPERVREANGRRGRGVPN
jgi:hypothetical protein